MAVATAAVADRKKSVFRQALTALRYAVAGAVTVVVIMTAVYAFRVAARTDDLYMGVVGNISVDQNQSGLGDYVMISFTLSVSNPSGRVRFYYTDIQGVIYLNDSSIHPSPVAESFRVPDMVVAPDSAMKIDLVGGLNRSSSKLTDDFLISDHFLISNQTLTENLLILNGSLTVLVYSAYNRTSVPARYCCWSVTVDDRVSGPSSNDTSSMWCDTCLTNDYSGAR